MTYMKERNFATWLLELRTGLR